MGYCVYHVQKGSGSGGGLGSHIDREEGKERVYKNADPERTKYNANLAVTKYCEMPISKAIEERIKDGYTGKTIRKDAVKYIMHMLTGSHDDMKAIFSDKEKRTQWVQQNYNFICDRYGKDNIVRFTLHVDEKTPHIHCVTVPLMSDGRLSAKLMIGDRDELKKTQDMYADYMSDFTLERGVRGSKARHTDVKEFYSRINEAKEIEISKTHVSKFELSDPPKLIGVADWKEKESKRINEFIDEAVIKQMDIGAELIKLSGFKTANEKIREKEFRRLKNEINELKANLKAISVDFDKFKKQSQKTISDMTNDARNTTELLKSQKGITDKYKNGNQKLIDLLIDVAKGDKFKKDVESFLISNKIYNPQINRGLSL